MPSRGKDSYSIQSVDNALDVLEALCEEGDEVRISRLSEKLGMNKTSVFRLLATFENRGYVEREKGTGKYRLGLSAYEMGQKFLSRMTLLRKARPVMEKLVRECDEAVYLTVRRDSEVLFLDQVDTPQQVKIVSLVGKRYPLEGVAAGKIILANTPIQDADAGRKPAQGSGEKPLTDKDLQKIHQRGACTDRGQLGEGIASLAVPLFVSGGEIAGSLCMVGPEFRMTPEKIETEMLPTLREAGEIVSSKLGFLRPHLGSPFV